MQLEYLVLKQRNSPCRISVRQVHLSAGSAIQARIWQKQCNGERRDTKCLVRNWNCVQLLERDVILSRPSREPKAAVRNVRRVARKYSLDRCAIDNTVLPGGSRKLTYIDFQGKQNRALSPMIFTYAYAVSDDNSHPSSRHGSRVQISGHDVGLLEAAVELLGPLILALRFLLTSSMCLLKALLYIFYINLQSVRGVKNRLHDTNQGSFPSFLSVSCIRVRLIYIVHHTRIRRQLSSGPRLISNNPSPLRWSTLILAWSVVPPRQDTLQLFHEPLVSALEDTIDKTIGALCIARFIMAGAVLPTRGESLSTKLRIAVAFNFYAMGLQTCACAHSGL